MSKLSILKLRYNLSIRPPSKPKKWLSAEDRQDSDQKAYEPDVREMKHVFDKISKKGEKISENHLKSLLEAFGDEDAACEAKRMIKVADLDGDGFIDFDEFMELHKEGIRTSDIRSAFRMFDQDGNERFSAEEVWSMLKRLGEDCTLEQCRRMIRHVGKNGDRFVGMRDFMDMMIHTMKPT